MKNKKAKSAVSSITELTFTEVCMCKARLGVVRPSQSKERDLWHQQMSILTK